MKAFVFLCVVAVARAAREPVEKTCTEKPETGPCLAYFPMYYYDPETGTCKPFVYGGCRGNGNRYASEEDCLENCAAKQAALDRPDCDKDPDPGVCDAYIPRYYYDQKAGQCKIFIYGGCGGNRNNFRTREECYNKCGALRTQSPCEQEMDIGPCRGAFPRYYYNKKTGQCEKFIYGGCAGNDNNFQRKEVCEAVCVVSGAAKAPPFCSLKPEEGLCRGYFPMYYYDPETESCKDFVYGGCGGNENRFETEEDCLEACSS